MAESGCFDGFYRCSYRKVVILSVYSPSLRKGCPEKCVISLFFMIFTKRAEMGHIFLNTFDQNPLLGLDVTTFHCFSTPFISDILSSEK